MNDRIMPDYKRIAQECVDKTDVEKELIDAYEKGYSAGYIDGNDTGWASIWDDDTEWVEAWEKATLEDVVPEAHNFYFNIKDSVDGDDADPEEER